MAATVLEWQENLITGEQGRFPRPSVPAVKKKRKTSVALDRWENPVSGYGSEGVDPVASTFFSYTRSLSLQELDALYKNWLARRIVQELVNDALRSGFSITSDKNESGAETVTKLLKKWKTELYVKYLGYQARQYGGAAKINYINDGLPTGMPVNWRMVKDVEQVDVIGRFYARPIIFYSDPSDLKTFKKPWIYQITDIAYNIPIPTYQAHHERLSWMDGLYLPNHLKVRNWGSGDSVLEITNEELKAYGSSIQSLAATIQDFVVKVFQVEDMEDLLEENEEELAYRVRMANAQSNIHKTSVIGRGEDLKKISTPITGLPQSVELLMDAASAAAQMPKSKLFGHMSGTLGSSSGKYDRGNWDSQVETFQTEKMQPAIEDDMKIACAITGTNFEDLTLKWPPVREKGEQEEANIRKTNAEAEKIELENEQKKKENGKGTSA